ncbi:hypothetical protein [Idiomarina sp.]|uniref:hypothetical protein n=1 Tax=Idiomarina sp. TaxID=1874361 RepID=UPI003A9390B4
MDWYSVGLAAASGCIAALIASLIFVKNKENKENKEKKEKKVGFTIVFIVLFFTLNTLSKQFILPEVNAYKAKSDVESVFDEVPAFVSIKKHEPVIYQKLKDSIADAARNDYSQQQTIDLIRTQIAGLVESRLPHASDEAILAYMNVMVSSMEELQRQGLGLCYRFLFPQVEGGVDGRKVFSQETQKKDLLALDKIIKTSDSKKKIPSDSDVMPYLGPILAGIYTKFGDDISMIKNPTAKNVDKGKVCIMTMEIYKNILALPPEQAANALRWMFRE